VKLRMAGEVIFEFKDGNGNSCRAQVPIGGEIRDILDAIKERVGLQPLIYFSVDPDGITSYLVLSNKLKEAVKVMLSEGKLPPTPVIKVRLWVSSLSENPETETYVTYHHLSPFSEEKEAELIKVVVVLFFASLIALLPSLIEAINPSPIKVLGIA